MMAQIAALVRERKTADVIDEIVSGPRRCAA